MKKILFVGAVVLVTANAAFAQQEQKAREILYDMSEKYGRLTAYQFNFVSKIEDSVENIIGQDSCEMTVKTVKGEMVKLNCGDQEVYSNGETMWIYFGDVNKVNIHNFESNDRKLTPATIYDAYKDGYKYRFAEEKKEGSKTLNVIELQPEKGTDQFDDLVKIKLEIDKDTNTLSYAEIYYKSGLVFSYKISGLNPRPSLSDSFFEFDIAKHPGVEVVDQR